MSDHKYRLRYVLKTEPGEFGIKDHAQNEGLTDALLVFSILYLEDGSYSQMHMSFDGRNVVDGKAIALNDNEIFKVWIMLGAHLARSAKLGIAKHLFVKTVWETFCERFMSPKKEK